MIRIYYHLPMKSRKHEKDEYEDDCDSGHDDDDVAKGVKDGI